jgi:hypothetical protein
MATGSMICIPNFVMIESGIQITIRLWSQHFEKHNIGKTDGEIYKVCHWDGLRWHYIHMMLYDNQFRKSSKYFSVKFPFMLLLSSLFTSKTPQRYNNEGFTACGLMFKFMQLAAQMIWRMYSITTLFNSFTSNHLLNSLFFMVTVMFHWHSVLFLKQMCHKL